MMFGLWGPSKWVKKLKTANYDEQNLAEEELVKMGSRAVPTLVRRLQNPARGVSLGREELIQQIWASALGRIKDRTAIKPLANALGHKNAHVRGCAAFALSRIGGDLSEAIEKLIPVLEDKNFHTVIRVIYALAVSGDPRAVDALVARICNPHDGDGHFNIEEACLKGLAEHTDRRRVVESLRSSLDKAPGYRRQGLETFLSELDGRTGRSS